MTNDEIIFTAAVGLGLLTEEEVEEIFEEGGYELPLHTYAGWKDRGYQVKKGEKAVAKVLLWKPRPKRKKMGEEVAEEDKMKFLMVNSALFSKAQIEKI